MKVGAVGVGVSVLMHDYMHFWMSSKLERSLAAQCILAPGDLLFHIKSKGNFKRIISLVGFVRWSTYIIIILWSTKSIKFTHNFELSCMQWLLLPKWKLVLYYIFNYLENNYSGSFFERKHLTASWYNTPYLLLDKLVSSKR